MRILFLASGPRVPSTRFRVLPYLPHFAAAGHSVTLLSSFPEKYRHIPSIGYRLSHLLRRMVRVLHLAHAWRKRYDVVFVERELFSDATSAMEERFRRVAPVMVLDIDDGIFLQFPSKFERLVPLVDLVVAGNDLIARELAPRARRVVTIPTAVDMTAYHEREWPTTPTPCIIGWIGTAVNLVNLDCVLPALRHLAPHLSFELRVIADDPGPLRSLNLDGVPWTFRRWSAATEANDLRELDLGLMPLHDTAWNRYKCGAKLLQYMACGIPGIASPVGANSEIVRHGETGYLAHNDAQWEWAIAQLIERPDLRRTLGTAARQRVRDRYSIQANAPLLVAAIERTLASTRS